MKPVVIAHMLDMSKSPEIRALLNHMQNCPGQDIPARHLKPLLELLSEAAVVLNFYARESSWFPIRSTEKFTFYALTEGDATKRARAFIMKWGMGVYDTLALPHKRG